MREGSLMMRQVRDGIVTALQVPLVDPDIAKDAVPWATKLVDIFKTAAGHPPEDKLLPESRLAQVAYEIQDLFSVPYVPRIESETKAARAGGEVQRRIQGEFKNVVQSIAREAGNLPAEKRMAYIQEQIDKRITDAIVPVMGHPEPAKMAALKSIASILWKADASNTKTETLQQMNLAEPQEPQAPVPPAP
jgi:hypothetical protein